MTASFDLLVFTVPGAHSELSGTLANAPCRPPVLVDLRAAAPVAAEADLEAQDGQGEPAPALYTQAELDDALAAEREMAASEARAEVAAEFEARLKNRLAGALERSAEQLEALVRASDASAAQRAEVDLAFALAQAILPHALARAPLADIEAMLLDLLPRLEAEPRLELVLAPELVEAGRRMAEELAGHAGFAGALVVSATAGLAPGDAQVKWCHGRAVRQIARVTAEVEAALATLDEVAPEANAAVTETEPALTEECDDER